MKHTTVKHITVYPIKGAQGISLDRARVLTEGLEYDRRWMLVEEDGTFISQRNFPQLTQLQVRIEENNLHAEINGESIEIPLLSSIESMQTVHVWKSTFQAGHISKEFDAFFSDHLGKSLRLINLHDEKARVKGLDIPPHKTTVSFADGYPILLLGQNSLDHLSERLGVEVSASRFRPNIIVETVEPHQEDSWLSLFNEGLELQSIKPCVRCQVINIDPISGASSPEVTKELVAYRRTGNALSFGMNMIVNRTGVIRVGDQLKINA